MLTLRHAGAADGGSAVGFWESRDAQLAAFDEWKADLESNLWVENFLDTARTHAAVTEYAAEVEAPVGAPGLRKLP